MDLMGGVGRSKQTTSFVVVAMLFSAMVVASYYFLGDAFPTPAAFNPTIASNSVRVVDKGKEELARILERAATADKTVMVTNLNEAWAAPGSLFEMMLESFRRGNNTERLIKHLVVVAVDDKAYSRCLSMSLNCFFLEVQGFNFSGKEAFFKSSNYLEIIWRKVDVLHSILSLGYNFFFTDTDIMWFRDPFIHLQDDADLQVSCDRYNGHPTDIFHNYPNTGIMYVKSNRRTLLFFKLWYYARRFYEGKHEQEVFDAIKVGPVMRITGLKVKFLDPNLFGSFCTPSKDFNQVCTMHANCCTGLRRKIHDLKLIMGDWEKYSALSSTEKPPYPFRWTGPMQCPRRYP